MKRIAVTAIATLLAGSICLVLLFRIVPPPFSALMVSRALGAGADGAPSSRVETRWTPLHRLPCHLVHAVVAAEDQKFEVHHGFDVDGIKRALVNNLEGRRLQGGSTISQQTAKNLFLWPNRSYVRKGVEAYFTLIMELTWTKRRILEVYLNIVELGRGVYGVEAAARRYFEKPAGDLTRRESATLAAMLPAPLERHPAAPSQRLKRKQAWILDQMNRTARPSICGP